MNDKGARSSMRPASPLNAITVRVPGPFAGVDELGFTARYPEQSILEPQRDVPLWIEGPAPSMRRLLHRLRMLVEAADRPYAWSEPVQLADEVVIFAFRDRTSAPALAQHFSDCFANLVRPVVFPFLADCAHIAHLRLSDRIEILVEAEDWPIARFVMRVGQVVPANGFDLLGESA